MSKSNRVSDYLKRIIRDCIFIAVITLAAELFIFNINYWRSLDNVPVDITAQMSIDGASLLESTSDAEGNSTAEEAGSSTAADTATTANVYSVDSGSSVTFYCSGLDTDVESLYLGLQFSDDVVDYEITITDDGNEANPYGLSTQQILKWVGLSHYMTIHPYGKVQTLKIVFRASQGSTFSLEGIQLNPKREVNLRWGRILLTMMLLAIIVALHPHSGLHKIKPPERALNVFFLVIGIATVTFLMQVAGGGWRTYAYNTEYADLARALAHGQVHLDYEVDPGLLTMENPYDYTMREAMHLETYWDTAYYNGQYYVYFGVVPVVLTYLPYYLVTGQDLNNVDAAWIFAILALMGSIWLIHEIKHRYFPTSPYWALPVMVVLLGFQAPLVYLYSRGDIYNIPILAANAFVMLGLAAWIRALKVWTKKSAAAFYLCMGSLFMALVAGCRPQMVLAAFLAIPILWEQVFRERELFSKKSVGRTAAFLMPFVIVAALLMAYNAVRFGSVFDFGANYNLTTNDMTRRGFNLDRIPGGVFYLLFQPPVILATFPFIRTALNSSYYMGKTILEANYGGVVFMSLITFFLAGMGHTKVRLREKKVYAMVRMLQVLTLVLCVADATIAGMVPRYEADFSTLLTLAAILMVLALLEKFHTHQLYPVLAGIMNFIVIYTILLDVVITLIAISNRDASLIPNVYYTAKSYLTLY